MNVYLYLACLLFTTGIVLLVTKRNAILALIGIELMLNAANILFVTASARDPNHEGLTVALVVIALAASEAVIGLVMILRMFKRTGSSDLADFIKLSY